jgi:flagellar hook assembly protein FlgD
LVYRANAFPNPFSKSTLIKYTLREPANVRIDIYNAIGSKVANIQEGIQTAGDHHADFEADNLSPGVYYYVARVGSNVLCGKVILIK